MNITFWEKTVLATLLIFALGAGHLWGAENSAEQNEEESLAAMINEHVTVSGAIEIETFWEENYEDVYESSIELATAEIGLEVRVTDWAQGTLLVEWDGDEDKIVVADAFITIGNTEKCPFTLTGGRLTVPFGVYETNMISDPLTLEIGEGQEDSLILGFEKMGYYVSFFVYNGDTNKGGGDSTIEQFGATFGYTMDSENISLDVGIGYLSSLLDSDGLTDSMPDGLESDYVGGLVVHFVAEFGDVMVIGEYVSGLDDAVELAEEIVNHGKPAAWNLEAGYTFGEIDITVALAVQVTNNLGGILPEMRVVSSVGFGLAEGLNLAFQYGHDEDYEVVDGGTGGSADSITAQLAYEF